MTLEVTVRRVSNLDDEELQYSTEIMAETFKEDPLLAALVGGDLRLDLSQALFKAFIAAAIVDGETYFAQQDNKVVGVACWFGPGKEFLNSPEQREAGWNQYWDGGLNQLGKSWQTETYLPRFNALYSRCLPKPTSKFDGYHLTLLGILPALRGKGIGGRLVKEGLDRAHKQGALVCLDTYTDIDVSIYKRWGFRVGGTELMTSPWGDFFMHVMIWEPEVTADSDMTGPEIEEVQV